jgi:hypothetical protein
MLDLGRIRSLVKSSRKLRPVRPSESIDWIGADEMLADRRVSHVKMVQITQGLTGMLDCTSKSRIQLQSPCCP